MFDNLVLGPMCIVYTPEDRKRFLKEMSNNNFMPLGRFNKGQLFDRISIDMSRELQVVKEIIICIAYIKPYE